jgi:phytoene synthase
MLVYYQFCRAVDDLADEPGLTPSQRMAGLEAWREAMLGERALPEDLAGVFQRHPIDRRYPLALIEGMEQDVKTQPFATETELHHYCWQVAGAVGLACNAITGCRHPDSTAYAEHLGQALQLTNILRDVREDAGLGRVYFSEEALARAEVRREDLLEGNPGKGFATLWQAQAAQARLAFARVSGGPPPPDRRALCAAEAMRRIYHRLLDIMCRDGGRVWERSYRLAPWQKFSSLMGWG